MALGHLFQPGMTNVVSAVHDASTRWQMGRTGGSIRIVNPSADRAIWVEFGDAGVVADQNRSMLILPRATVQWRLPSKATHLAVLAEPAAPTAKSSAIAVNITWGEGS